MTTLHKDPAFPSHGSMGEVTHEGMSLRDWFAGQALAGLMGNFWVTKDYTLVAAGAYAAADAMLAFRAQGKRYGQR